MAQDFAKNRKSASKSSKKKPARAATRSASQESNHWSWFISGLFSGMLFCVIGYFALTNINNTSFPDIGATAQNADGEEASQGTQLDFYEYLPQAEVEVNVVPVDIASSSDGEEGEANPTTYLLQAGSFQNANDAEELRARIILLNLDARIQPVSLSGRTWYRVQAGPFSGRNPVESAERMLVENNIDPIRLRIPTP